MEDAHVFYYLEAWIASPVDSSATHYLEQIELFQRQLTTAAFRLAGGIEVSSSSLVKLSKQHPIPQAFVSKIVKAFMDSLYALLDGLVLLASDASPIVTGKRPITDTSLSIGPNSLELLDLTDNVCVHDSFLLSGLRKCTGYPNFSGDL
jgi:exocyst complex component 2